LHGNGLEEGSFERSGLQNAIELRAKFCQIGTLICSTPEETKVKVFNFKYGIFKRMENKGVARADIPNEIVSLCVKR
jgi:hypothetical protein